MKLKEKIDDLNLPDFLSNSRAKTDNNQKFENIKIKMKSIDSICQNKFYVFSCCPNHSQKKKKKSNQTKKKLNQN